MKIGDKVVLLKSPFHSEELLEGKTGVIIGTLDGYVQVAMDSGYGGPGEYWTFEPQEVKVIKGLK